MKLALLFATAAFASAELPTVGIEGRMEVLLPGGELKAIPTDRAAPITVRIASAQARVDGFQYDLRYIGLVPGEHDLRKYLVAQDGALISVPPLIVQIASVLPEVHRGELLLHETPLARLFGSYRWLIASLAGLWVAMGLLLAFRRRRKETPAPSDVPAAPSLAERLRPLVEQAAQGSLTTDQQAQLERLLLGHWQERLGLEKLSATEAITHLRAHPEAGQLLRMLEDWLRRPPGTATADPAAALAHYAHLTT